jgi:lysophospholipase L1-like esterase
MADIDTNYTGLTKLRDWWGRVKTNFSNINTQLVNHVAGTADQHTASKIDNDTVAAGDNLKQVIDNLSITGSEHDAFVTGALIDTEDEDFGLSGTGTYLNGRLGKWEQRQTNAENSIGILNGAGAIAEKANKTDVDTHIADNAAHGLGTYIAKDNNIAKSQKKIKPLHIEQFMQTYYGRGLLTVENAFGGNNGRTNFSQNYSAGAATINVANASMLSVGSIVAIEYLDGTHLTHFVNSKTGNQIIISPALKSTVDTTSTIERGWNTAAHAGEYTMRYISEQLANATIDNHGTGNTIFELTGDDMTAPYALRGYYAIGGGVIGVNVASSLPGAQYQVPQQTVSGNGPYVVCTNNGDGIRCPEFKVTPGSKVTIRGYVRVNTPLIARLVSKTGTVIGTYAITTTNDIFKKIVFSAYIPLNIIDAHLEFAQNSASGATAFIDDVEVIENIDSANNYIVPRYAKIVMLFDSWGLQYNNVIETNLRSLLPNATIINKSVGGNTALDMINRFDTDVTSQNPDVVLINVGVNDAYGMASNDDKDYIKNLNLLIDKCRNIGATPVFLGIPALAETDTNFPAFTSFQLTDRARIMAADARRAMQNQKPRTNLLNITFAFDSLAAGASKSISLGAVTANTIITIKQVAGYLPTSVKMQVGLATDVNNALAGTANNADLTTTNYFERATMFYIDPALNYSFKNSDGVDKLLVVRAVNDSAGIASGAIVVTLEI